MQHFGGGIQSGTMTLKFKLGRDFCTMHLSTKFNHATFNHSEIILLTNKQPKKLDSMHWFSHLCRCYTTQLFTYLLMHSVISTHCFVYFCIMTQQNATFWGMGPRVGHMTPNSNSSKIFCTTHLATKFHHPMFNCLEVIVLEWSVPFGELYTSEWNGCLSWWYEWTCGK